MAAPLGRRAGVTDEWEGGQGCTGERGGAQRRRGVRGRWVVGDRQMVGVARGGGGVGNLNIDQ